MNERMFRASSLKETGMVRVSRSGRLVPSRRDGWVHRRRFPVRGEGYARAKWARQLRKDNLLADTAAAIAIARHRVATIWASRPLRLDVAIVRRSEAVKPWRGWDSPKQSSPRSRAWRAALTRR
jgi:hypothetical protein